MARQKHPPEIAEAMNKFKFEVAGELGIPLNDYDNGDLTSRDCGRIGGTMVKRLIELGQQVLVANYEAAERRKNIKLVHSQKRPKMAKGSLVAASPAGVRVYYMAR